MHDWSFFLPFEAHTESLRDSVHSPHLSSPGLTLHFISKVRVSFGGSKKHLILQKITLRVKSCLIFNPLCSPDGGRVVDVWRDFIVETLFGRVCVCPIRSHGGEETRFTFVALLAFACFFRADSDPPSVDFHLPAIHLCMRVKWNQQAGRDAGTGYHEETSRTARLTCELLGDFLILKWHTAFTLIIAEIFFLLFFYDPHQ